MSVDTWTGQQNKTKHEKAKKINKKNKQHCTAKWTECVLPIKNMQTHTHIHNGSI